MTPEDVAKAIDSAPPKNTGVSPKELRDAIQAAVAKALPTVSPKPTPEVPLDMGKRGGIPFSQIRIDEKWRDRTYHNE